MSRKYFLLIKTHKRTGLKYLCKHFGTKESCNKYCGSGLYWCRHLKKHGRELSTTILLETKSLFKLKKQGMHYSKLWNIVKNNDWANLVVEAGEGVGWPKGYKHTSKSKRKISVAHKGKTLSLITRQKISRTRIKLGLSKGRNNPMFGKHPISSFKGRKHTQETIEKNRLAHLGSNNAVFGKQFGKNNPNWKGGRSHYYKRKLRLMNHANKSNKSACLACVGEV